MITIIWPHKKKRQNKDNEKINKCKVQLCISWHKYSGDVSIDQ
jgi:hypothetical protein